jgi:glycosyltransferase involved in cell wall biosynthesis
VNPRLGVCIPTYKRPDQLEACVHSVIAAGAAFELPVFIADDSTDATNDAALGRLRASYPHIVVAKNPRNLGIDRNILNSVDLCTCGYAWLLGEDDRLRPGAVAKVLAALDRGGGRPPFVFVNYAAVDESATLVLKERALRVSCDADMAAADFMREHAWAAGFIGGCVVRKDLWARVAKEPYVGTYFAHVGAIAECIRGGRVEIVADPVVLNRCGTTETFTWASAAFDVLGGWSRLLRMLEPLYGRDVCRGAVRSFERAHGLGTLKFLCYMRADGALSADTWRTHIRGSERPLPYKAAAAVVARTPRLPFRAARAVLSAVRRVLNPRVVAAR